MHREYNTLMAKLKGCPQDIRMIANLAEAAWNSGQQGLALALAKDAWCIFKVLQGV